MKKNISYKAWRESGWGLYAKEERDVVRQAMDLIERDATEVYDACANVGQIVDNLPYRALVNIVVAYLEEGG